MRVPPILDVLNAETEKKVALVRAADARRKGKIVFPIDDPNTTEALEDCKECVQTVALFKRHQRDEANARRDVFNFAQKGRNQQTKIKAVESSLTTLTDKATEMDSHEQKVEWKNVLLATREKVKGLTDLIDNTLLPAINSACDHN